MNTPEVGTVTNPMHVALRTGKPPSMKDLIGITLISVLPIAIAVLMQKPALRQMLVMRSFHYGKEVCHGMADALNKAGDMCSTQYNKARM